MPDATSEKSVCRSLLSINVAKRLAARFWQGTVSIGLPVMNLEPMVTSADVAR
jgi:hypothetical protein